MMKVKGRRALVALAAVAASVAVSGIEAVSAQASLSPRCTGTSITGQGASLQGAAQSIWTSTTLGFNAANSINATGSGCNTDLNHTPMVAYDVSSSGACLTGFGATAGEPLNRSFAFCGTDDAPTAAELERISTAADGARALTIPVAQTAIAVVVNPPAGCTVGGITPQQLEGAFRGTTGSWTTLGGVQDTAGACESTITRVVRADNSGTTYQFKRYLGTINGGVVHAGLTWTQLQGGTNNTTWPDPATVDFSRSGCATHMALPCTGVGSGGSDEVRTVGVASGSIGYAALPDARSVTETNVTVGGGPTWPNLKWIPLRFGAVNRDPSTNGLSDVKAQSNCAGTVYDAPAAGATGDWSGVSAGSASTTYPICTLTWDLAFNNYATATYSHSAGVARTVRDYLHYVLLDGADNVLAGNNDYGPLPANIRETATTGVQEITG